jgi:hypothetical protein
VDRGSAEPIADSLANAVIGNSLCDHRGALAIVWLAARQNASDHVLAQLSVYFRGPHFPVKMCSRMVADASVEEQNPGNRFARKQLPSEISHVTSIHLFGVIDFECLLDKHM